MPGNPREMITAAERLFPVRIRIGVPPGGLGQRYSQITDWLDANCGADGWALTPAGTRGVLNDARSTSRMRRLPEPSSPGGASGPRSRRPAAYSRYARTSRCRGSERGCIGRREGDHTGRRREGRAVY
jgi:hypothetical protein